MEVKGICLVVALGFSAAAFGFDQTFEFQGITFQVSRLGTGS